MALTLPRLDDRRWTDLVEEGRGLLPLHTPEWTDHNLHDPGITFLELFAWITEIGLYRLDRIPAAHRLKFLALLGAASRLPRGAEVAVGFRLRSAGPGTHPSLPAGLVLDAQSPGGERVQYATSEPVVVVPGTIAALQAATGGEVRDLTAAWRRGERVPTFGEDPVVGDALYIGFSEPPPAGVPLSLYFEVEGGGNEERRRIAAREGEKRCRPPGWERCREGGAVLEDDHTGNEALGASPLRHHSVRLAWEVATSGGSWRPLEPAAGEVEEDTRGLTLSGRLTFRLSVTPSRVRVGEVEAALPYLRCRIVGGAYDAPPRLDAVLFNGVRTIQEVPVGAVDWSLVPGAVVEGEPPEPGTSVRLEARFDDEGRIARLVTGSPQAPELFVLAWEAPGPDVGGHLSVEAAPVGVGNGRPGQAVDLPERLPAGYRLAVVSREDGRLHAWSRQSHLDASGRTDAHFLVEPRPEDASSGRPLARLRFGDGEHGRAVPEAAPVWAAYRATRGPAGAVGPNAVAGLANVAGNRARLPALDAVAAHLAKIDNPLSASGGSLGESLDEMARRALEATESSERAVTLGDYERLALATPGVRLARAEARAERHPAFPCRPAPGVVTVLVLPRLPADRPTASAGLLTAVAGHLNRRRVLGTRVEVAGPTHVAFAVRARVRARPGVAREALVGRLGRELDRFFHPLTGGPDGSGWPFGRAIYANEVRQVLDQAEGADHVLSLELVGSDGEPRCNNLCLPPNGLPAVGAHEIAVEGGADPC